MKKIKYILEQIVGVIIFSAILMIPFLNVFILTKYKKNTISTWTSHKDIFWCTTDKVKITLCNGKENQVIYEGDLIHLECDDRRKAKAIRNAEIKYVRLADVPNCLEIRLWNNNKINKFYGIKTEY